MKHISTTVRSWALAACAACLTGGAWAQTVASIAIADKPLRIIRGAAVYKAAGGTIVQKDDIIETAAGSAQIDAGPGAIFAMGPGTRLYVAGLAADGKAAELQLLQGWVKLASQSAARASVAATNFQASLGAGAVIVSSRPGKDALFADEGELLAARIDDKGKPGAPVKVPPEQFAFALAGQPLVVQPRPAKDFLADMPPQFRDRLAPVPASAKAPRLAAVKERDADFADVGPWLGSSLPARKSFVARFRARLKDPNFRKLLEQALGASADWRPALKPPAAQQSAPNRNDNPIY
jgi:hypothetical protein